MRLWMPIAWSLTACTGGPPPKSTARVVVVGMDGLDRKMLDRLGQAGALPHFTRLRTEGITADLQVTQPMLSPRIWTTLASGYPSDIHGVHGWMRRPGVLYTSGDVAVDRVWDVASAAGMKVLIAGWLVTHPPTPVEGALISDTFDGGVPMSTNPADKRLKAPPVRAGTTWPEALAGEADEWVPDEDWLRDHDLGWQLGDYGPPTHPLRRDEAYLRAFEALDPTVKPDLAALYFSGADQVSHHFWPFVDPDATAAMQANPNLRIEAARRDRTHISGDRPYPWTSVATTPEILTAGARWVPGYYRYLDDALGRVMDRIDPATTTLIVLSDHGFQSSRQPSPALYGEHRNPAVLMAWGAALSARGGVGPIPSLDVGPTLYRLLDLPVAGDMTGRARDELFSFSPERKVQTRRRAVAAPAPVDPEAAYDPRRMQQLEALGYIDQEGRPVPRK